MPKSFQITVTDEEIKSMLIMSLNNKHAKLMADVIIGNLSNTEVGLQQLYFAMQGQFTDVKFKAGEEIRIEYRFGYTFYFDEYEMKNRGYVENGLIKGEVVEVDPYRKDKVLVKYNYWHKDKNAESCAEHWIDEEAVHSYNDF